MTDTTKTVETTVETAPKKSPAKKPAAPKAEGTAKTPAKKTTAPKAEGTAKAPAKKTTAAKAEGATKAPAKKPATKAPAKAVVEEVAPAVEVAEVAPVAEVAKKPVAKKAKKADKANAPLYINGRYVKEIELKAKPAKGHNPYVVSDKQVKITLVKSTVACLSKQKKTIIALGLRKIGHSVVKKDNDALQGMLFVVKHLVKVEDVK